MSAACGRDHHQRMVGSDSAPRRITTQDRGRRAIRWDSLSPCRTVLCLSLGASWWIYSPFIISSTGIATRSGAFTRAFMSVVEPHSGDIRRFRPVSSPYLPGLIYLGKVGCARSLPPVPWIGHRCMHGCPAEHWQTGGCWGSTAQPACAVIQHEPLKVQDEIEPNLLCWCDRSPWVIFARQDRSSTSSVLCNPLASGRWINSLLRYTMS